MGKSAGTKAVTPRGQMSQIGALAIAKPDEARAVMRKALTAHSNNATHAAASLGITYRTWRRLVAKLKL